MCSLCECVAPLVFLPHFPFKRSACVCWPSSLLQWARSSGHLIQSREGQNIYQTGPLSRSITSESIKHLGEQKVSFRSSRSGQSEAQSRRKVRANSRRAGGSLCLAGASWPPSLPSQRKHLIRQLGLRCVLFTQEGKVSLEVVYQLYGFDICKRLQECHVHRQSAVSSSGLLNISACRQKQGSGWTRAGQTF